jgi:hypothetical protein
MSKGSQPRPFTDREIFEANFDKIFKVKKKPSSVETIKEYEYELHPSTGNVEKVFKDGS